MKNQRKQTAIPKGHVSYAHKPETLDLEQWQRLLRKEFGTTQRFVLRNIGDHPVFSEFSVTNPQSGKTYRVAIRGDGPGENYCSCPDYSINNLGTCKHIEFTLFKLKKKKGVKKVFQRGFQRPFSEVYLSYGLRREVRFKPGEQAPQGLLEHAKAYFDSTGTLLESRILDFHTFLDGIPRDNHHEVRCYDDVMAFIAEHQDAEHRRNVVADQLKDGIDTAVFKSILKTRLYPYQCEGALFAVRTGRCLIGDDMGLGKTIQALAAAELMVQLFNIQKVLIVSPTSLKHQWKAEIDRFSGRRATVIEGGLPSRLLLYHDGSFYKLMNYELVSKDMEMIHQWAPDLIILDEAQRIKNWKTRTAKSVKLLESTFAIVLTGTPIENRIEELHSIMEFIDRRKLGPLYRFVHSHRITDPGGKVVGYRALQTVREVLKDVFIRRKKDEVLKQLPVRTDKNFFVPLTAEQRRVHDAEAEIVAKLVAKWRRYKFLCEADQRRLRIALNYMRMAADNTYLVDGKSVHGPKIEEMEVVLKELVIEGDERVVIFSQWLRMLELAEQVLIRNKIGHVWLHGGVPSKDRKDMIARFKDDPECKVFLSTDAGGLGLNLQSGSNVINLDTPWNPAVLEQRICRVHRLGQHKNVRVINFVSEGSIEERILDLLKFKRALFTGVLDEGGEDVVMVGSSQMDRFMESVERLTENVQTPAPATQGQETGTPQDRADHGAAVPEPQRMENIASVYGNAPDPLNDLLKSGAEFLTSLNRVLSTPGQSDGKAFGVLIQRDSKTGRNYLNLPLPEPGVIKDTFARMGDLLAKMAGERRT